MTMRQMGEPVPPGDATRWRDSLLAAAAVFAAVSAIELIAHSSRYWAVLAARF